MMDPIGALAHAKQDDIERRLNHPRQKALRQAREARLAGAETRSGAAHLAGRVWGTRRRFSAAPQG